MYRNTNKNHLDWKFVNRTRQLITMKIKIEKINFKSDSYLKKKISMTDAPNVSKTVNGAIGIKKLSTLLSMGKKFS